LSLTHEPDVTMGWDGRSLPPQNTVVNLLTVRDLRVLSAFVLLDFFHNYSSTSANRTSRLRSIIQSVPASVCFVLCCLPPPSKAELQTVSATRSYRLTTSRPQVLNRSAHSIVQLQRQPRKTKHISLLQQIIYRASLSTQRHKLRQSHLERHTKRLRVHVQLLALSARQLRASANAVMVTKHSSVQLAETVGSRRMLCENDHQPTTTSRLSIVKYS